MWFKNIIFMISILMLIQLSILPAQTMISGNVSGTWTVAESPYYVIDNCAVPAGNTLNIEPGVTVVVGESLSVNVYGYLKAIGTAEDSIYFKAPNESIYWNQIFVNYAGSDTSKFVYCKISNARNGIYLRIEGKTNARMRTLVRNCTFISCKECGIYTYARGVSQYSWGGMSSYNPYNNPIIQNCNFKDTKDGCVFYIWGWYIGRTAPTSYGHSSPTITNNKFFNLEGTAIKFTIGNQAGTSYPVCNNNNFINCFRAIDARNPYDVTVKNNIFKDNKIAVQKTGTLTTKVTHNCFFNTDSSDFIGFPSTYGNVVMQNNNNDPCDISFNIFLDPEFEINNYYLSETSPCIDAGDPNHPYDPDNTIIDQGIYYHDQRDAILSINTSFIDFGALKLGKSKTDSLSILNSGPENLIINNLDISGPDSSAFIIDTSKFIVGPAETYNLEIHVPSSADQSPKPDSK